MNWVRPWKPAAGTLTIIFSSMSKKDNGAVVLLLAETHLRSLVGAVKTVIDLRSPDDSPACAAVADGKLNQILPLLVIKLVYKLR